jgi:hypothetical protein
MPTSPPALSCTANPSSSLKLAEESEHLVRITTDLLGERGRGEPIALRQQPLKLTRRDDRSGLGSWLTPS